DGEREPHRPGGEVQPAAADRGEPRRGGALPGRLPVALSRDRGEARPASRLPGRLLSALVVSVALYYAVLGGEYSALDLRRLADRKEEEGARLAAVRGEVDALRKLATALRDDPVTIERVAREQFGMIREGEILYRFVDVAPAEARLSSRTP